MSHLFHDVKSIILSILEEKVKEGILPEDINTTAITVEPPRDLSHGDMATNAALVLAKQAKMKPRDLAESIVKELEKQEDITSVEIAGPGFINMRIAVSKWQSVIADVLKEGKGYGNSSLGEGRSVNVEYVSANPTGPLHIGHARGAVFGDALAMLLLKAGYNVTKEYYINDAGAQIITLARSAYLRYREACGEEIGEIPEGLYPGDYLVIAGETIKEQYGLDLLNQSEEEWLPFVSACAIETMMTLIRSDLQDLGIEHDVFLSEKKLHTNRAIDAAMRDLEEKGLIYVGVLEPPKGKKPDDWEEREQTLFRSTDYGDDTDRAMKKSDGSYTYFAADTAYAQHKIRRNFDELIMVLGADHGGYQKRMQAAVDALSDGEVKLSISLCQLVNFSDNGKPLKMSKRAGTYITVRDVLDAVGKDALRFIMLTRKNDAPLDFDLQKVTEQSKDNPVFYVQYAHARAKSVLRHAAEQAPDAIALSKECSDELLSSITDPAELELVKQIASWPRIVEQAAAQYEPHRIAFYLQDLAATFHGLWNQGKDNTHLRFIQPDDIPHTAARLALVEAMATVIASGLFIFNVEPMEEMY